MIDSALIDSYFFLYFVPEKEGRLPMVSKFFCSVTFLISGTMLSGCVTTDNATGESSNIIMAAATDTDSKQPAEETSSSETDSGEPAPASNPEADAEAAAAAAEAEKNSKKVICKKLKPPTGTRLGGRRVCKTKSEWEFIYEQNKIYLRELQSTPGDPNVGQ